MIIETLIAAALTFSGAPAQTPPASTAPAAPTAMSVEIPEQAGAAADPTCGGRAALTQLATCVVTTQAAAPALMDAYHAAFAGQGWLAASGTDNRVVYVKRKPEGGCDAFQVLAFAADNAVAAPAAPAFFAFAAIPGDVCSAAPTPTQ